jgi:hypothetical protein
MSRNKTFESRVPGEPVEASQDDYVAGTEGLEEFRQRRAILYGSRHAPILKPADCTRLAVAKVRLYSLLLHVQSEAFLGLTICADGEGAMYDNDIQ